MNKEISLAQLAWKAGKVVSGDRLIPAIQSSKVYLVIVSSASGKNRKKKLMDKCKYYDVPFREIDALEFNQISLRSINSFGIIDQKFVQAMIEKG